jgi:hypothetical protein
MHGPRPFQRSLAGWRGHDGLASSQLASSLTLRREGSHVALAQDVALGRPPRSKFAGIDVVVYRLGGDAKYVCGFSNRHDFDTPLVTGEFASMPFAKSPEDGTDTVGVTRRSSDAMHAAARH